MIQRTSRKHLKKNISITSSIKHFLPLERTFSIIQPSMPILSKEDISEQRYMAFFLFFLNPKLFLLFPRCFTVLSEHSAQHTLTPLSALSKQISTLLASQDG